jgi:CheY-like chemotaxis protein
MNKVKNNPDTDLIIMNYMMPVMDGMEATRKIREFNKTVPVIMTSAAIVSSSDLMKKSEEVGCNDYLTVPFRLTQFLQKIEDHLGYQLTKK